MGRCLKTFIFSIAWHWCPRDSILRCGCRPTPARECTSINGHVPSRLLQALRIIHYIDVKKLMCNLALCHTYPVMHQPSEAHREIAHHTWPQWNLIIDVGPTLHELDAQIMSIKISLSITNNKSKVNEFLKIRNLLSKTQRWLKNEKT